MLRSFWMSIICCIPFYLSAQSVKDLTDPQLPQLKDCHMVVRIREVFPFPGTEQKTVTRDTESVFIIGPDGWAAKRLYSRQGRCAGEENLSFKEGKLCSRERRLSISSHSLFASPQQHMHKFRSLDSMEYRQGRLYREWNFTGTEKTLTRSTRYDYDAEGRVINMSFDFPDQSRILYPERFDAIQFEYAGDSVFEWKYRIGRIADSLKYQARYEKGQRILWRFAASDRQQQEERSRYDTSGKIVLNEWISNLPPVISGRIQRPDRIEFTYDDKGRPVEIKCLVRGLRCEAFYYSYLK